MLVCSTCPYTPMPIKSASRELAISAHVVWLFDIFSSVEVKRKTAIGDCRYQREIWRNDPIDNVRMLGNKEFEVDVRIDR